MQPATSYSYSFRERKTSKKGLVYDIVFRIIDSSGTERQKTLCGFATKTLAKKAYTDFMSTYIAPKKKYDGKSDLIYDNIIPLYFAALQNQIKESTIYEKQKLFALIITPYFENKKITDITKADLYLWQDELWAKKKKDGSFYSYKYLSKIRAYFSDFLRWCADRYGTVNYLYEVKKPKRRTPPHEMQFWERYEFDAFIAVVDNPLWHTFFLYCFSQAAERERHSR